MTTFSKDNLIHYTLAVGSAAFSRIAILLIMIMNGKVMSQQEFGLFSILFLVAYVFSGAVSGGGDLWLNPYTDMTDAALKAPPKQAFAYLKISLTLTTVSIFVIALWPSSWLDGHFPLQAVKWSLYYGAIVGWNEALFAVLRATNRVKIFFALRDILCPLFLISIALATHHLTAIQFFQYATAIYGILCLFVMGYMKKNHRIYFAETSSFSGLKRHTFFMIANTLMTRLITNIDVITLSFFMPLSFLGYYRIGAQIASGFTIVQHFTFLTLPWQLNAKNHEGSAGQNLNFIRQRQMVLLSSSTLACALIMGCAKPIVGFIYNETMMQHTLTTAFQVIVLLRYAEIVWGPSYALMISNNLTLRDNAIIMSGAFLWLCVFFASLSMMPSATVAAVFNAISLASLYMCWARYRVLQQQKLAHMTQMGLAIPASIHIIACIISYFWSHLETAFPLR